MLFFANLDDMSAHIQELIDVEEKALAQALANRVVSELRSRRLIPYMVGHGFMFNDNDTSLVDLATDIWKKGVSVAQRPSHA